LGLALIMDAVAPGGGCHRTVLVGSFGCAGSKMAYMGGIRGAGVLVLLPRSWRSPLDGGLYSGESLARRCQWCQRS
jgi:hypothetical protein